MYFIVRHIVRCDSVRLDQGERARDEDDVGGGINSEEEELCYCAKTRGHRELWETHLAQVMDGSQPRSSHSSRVDLHAGHRISIVIKSFVISKLNEDVNGNDDNNNFND